MTTTSTQLADTDYYRCGLIIRSDHKKCPVRGRVIRTHSTSNFQTEYTTWEHDHTAAKTKLPQDYRAEIAEQAKSKVRPANILKSTNNRLGNKYPLKIRQVRYEISKMSSSQPIVNFGDLAAWIKSKRAIPNDLDEPFCIGFTQNPSNMKFNAVFSTLRLLSHADQSIWCADTTYKTVWQGYPLNIIGAQDAMQKFHPLAVALSSNESTSEYQFVFESIKLTAEKLLNISVKPSHIMSDAAHQIPKAFSLVFSHVNGTNYALMCWFHVAKALKDKKCTKPDVQGQIMIDVNVLQQCPSDEIFKNVSARFIAYWSEFDKEFTDYFQKQWIELHPNWY